MLHASLRRGALYGLLALGLASPAMAAGRNIAGLGQPWPDAKDVSRAPGWHVYVFNMRGIRYIQVSDLTGRIIGVVGTANHEFITLPIGEFSDYVSTPEEPVMLPAVTAAPPVVVYKDATTQLSVQQSSTGVTQLQAAAACGNPVECNTNFAPQ